MSPLRARARPTTRMTYPTTRMTYARKLRNGKTTYRGLPYGFLPPPTRSRITGSDERQVQTGRRQYPQRHRRRPARLGYEPEPAEQPLLIPTEASVSAPTSAETPVAPSVPAPADVPMPDVAAVPVQDTAPQQLPHSPQQPRRSIPSNGAPPASVPASTTRPRKSTEPRRPINGKRQCSDPPGSGRPAKRSRQAPVQDTQQQLPPPPEQQLPPPEQQLSPPEQQPRRSSNASPPASVPTSTTKPNKSTKPRQSSRQQTGIAPDVPMPDVSAGENECTISQVNRSSSVQTRSMKAKEAATGDLKKTAVPEDAVEEAPRRMPTRLSSKKAAEEKECEEQPSLLQQEENEQQPEDNDDDDDDDAKLEGQLKRRSPRSSSTQERQPGTSRTSVGKRKASPTKRQSVKPSRNSPRLAAKKKKLSQRKKRKTQVKAANQKKQQQKKKQQLIFCQACEARKCCGELDQIQNETTAEFCHVIQNLWTAGDGMCRNFETGKSTGCKCMQQLAAMSADQGLPRLLQILQKWRKAVRTKDHLPSGPNGELEVIFLGILGDTEIFHHPNDANKDVETEEMCIGAKGDPSHTICLSSFLHILGVRNNTRFHAKYMVLLGSQQVQTTMLRNKLLRVAIDLKIEKESKRQTKKHKRPKFDASFAQVKRKWIGPISHAFYKEHFPKIRTFLNRDKVKILHPCFFSKTGGAFEDLEGLKSCDLFSICTRIKSKVNEQLKHAANPYVFKLPDECLEFMPTLLQEFVEHLGINGEKGGKLGPVGYKKDLKSFSTVGKSDGMTSLVEDVLKSKDDALIEGVEAFSATFREFIGDKLSLDEERFRLSIDAGFMISQPGMLPQNMKAEDCLYQSPHIDYKLPMLKKWLRAGNQVYIALMPMEREGMWVSYYEKPFENENEGLTMGHIPYGNIAFLPASLVHAGGFRTSMTGNKRCHFYIYADRHGAKATDNNMGHSNQYLFIPDEPKYCQPYYGVFTRESEWYFGAMTEFDELFQMQPLSL